jgi:hypothetical protein
MHGPQRLPEGMRVHQRLKFCRNHSLLAAAHPK